MIPSRETRDARVVRRERIGLDRAGIEAGGSDVQSRARLDDVADDEAEDEREGGEKQEIAERLARDPADRAQIAHPGDAVGDGQEDDRRDDHPDEFDETIAERLHRLTGRGPEMPEQCAGDDRDQDLHVEVMVPAYRWARGCAHVTTSGALLSVCRSIPAIVSVAATSSANISVVSRSRSPPTGS